MTAVSMVKNSIKVFARLKNESAGKKIRRYDIKGKEDYEDIVFCNVNQESGSFSSRHEQVCFRFHKIFDQNSSQSEVFETIAKPVVNSAIDGFNGTIFAYGQTGSGKTYAITGSSEDYEGRGIIPRCIQLIFEYTNASPDKYTVHISYLEIYKEIGYDLLNPKHKATRLEELPRVILLEDAKGEAHLRNLSVLPVCTEQEAMRLLFYGDTNRTIAETPMNDCSSRSHCIFTIYITARNSMSGRIRRSKLHLVDLAGSERVHKSNISGPTLTEAKRINLSLHYLEQVILALSKTKRSHIPYRNSMMTYMLRDSLSGNCLTVMLATLAVNEQNIQETVSTCRFAQRVALMSTEAKINEEIDPQREIALLRDEVEELRRQLILLKGINVAEKLTKEQEKHCKVMVKRYIHDSSKDLYIDCDLRKVQLCFRLMKKAILSQQKSENTNNNTHNETLEKFKEIIRQKDEEIRKLKDFPTFKTTCGNSENLGSNQRPNKDRFELFCEDGQHVSEVNYYKQEITRKLEEAKFFAKTVEQCQKNIIELRKQLGIDELDHSLKVRLNSHLVSQQATYRDALLKLENVKKETDHLRHGLEQAEISLIRKFQFWKGKSNNENVDHVLKSTENIMEGPNQKRTSAIILAEEENHHCQDVCIKACVSSDPQSSRSCDGFCNFQLKCTIDPLQPLGKENMQSSCNHQTENCFPSAKSFSNYCFPNYSHLGNCSINNNNCRANTSATFLNIGDDQFLIPIRCCCGTNTKSSVLQVVGKLCANSPDVSSTIPKENKLQNIQTNQFQYKNAPIQSIEHSTPCDETMNPSNDIRTELTTAESLDAPKTPELPSTDTQNNQNKPVTTKTLFRDSDTPKFIEFMKTVPLTDDEEVDDEIFNFYRSKFGL